MAADYYNDHDQCDDNNNEEDVTFYSDTSRGPRQGLGVTWDSGTGTRASAGAGSNSSSGVGGSKHVGLVKRTGAGSTASASAMALVIADEFLQGPVGRQLTHSQGLAPRPGRAAAPASALDESSGSLSSPVKRAIARSHMIDTEIDHRATLGGGQTTSSGGGVRAVGGALAEDPRLLFLGSHDDDGDDDGLFAEGSVEALARHKVNQVGRINKDATIHLY